MEVECMELYHKVKEAVETSLTFDKKYEIGIVLGSGLGDFTDQLNIHHIIDYKDVPYCPVSKVEGHAGQFYFGDIDGKNIICMKGRVHYYEGYSTSEITFPIRIMKFLGVKTLILTNACGAISDSINPGDLCLLKDHISLFMPSPLRGENEEKFGPRFPDMSHIYDVDLRQKIHRIALNHHIELKDAIYSYYPGPQYETPADIRVLKILESDLVGMSTVPEATIARHMDMKVIGISLATNKAAGLSKNRLSHEEVKAMADKVAEKFGLLLLSILKECEC